jgi:hypothetical protein
VILSTNQVHIRASILAKNRDIRLAHQSLVPLVISDADFWRERQDLIDAELALPANQQSGFIAEVVQPKGSLPWDLHELAITKNSGDVVLFIDFINAMCVFFFSSCSRWNDQSRHCDDSKHLCGSACRGAQIQGTRARANDRRGFLEEIFFEPEASRKRQTFE